MSRCVKPCLFDVFKWKFIVVLAVQNRSKLTKRNASDFVFEVLDFWLVLSIMFAVWKISKFFLLLPWENPEYFRSNSTMSPASGAGNVSEPRLMPTYR